MTRAYARSVYPLVTVCKPSLHVDEQNIPAFKIIEFPYEC
jgi:hypothetical protein